MWIVGPQGFQYLVMGVWHELPLGRTPGGQFPRQRVQAATGSRYGALRVGLQWIEDEL